MPSLKKLRTRGLCLAAVIALAVTTFGALATPQGMTIQRAQLIERDGDSIVSADIRYQFPEVALRALEEGIPLTFRIEFRAYRLKAFLRTRTLVEEDRTIQLRYQPLAKSYQVSDLGSGAVVHYASLATALDTLSHLRGWVIPSLALQLPGEKREASLRLYFDVEALPLPLRLVAYMSPHWKMDNPPYRWPLDQ